MSRADRTFSLTNIDAEVSALLASVNDLGHSVQGKFGLKLLMSLKRERLGTGPYAHVTLFEAANRVMSDLVILRGVAGLLKERAFPFDAYTVELGNEDNNGFDLRAEQDGRALIGEAFNVAPSFFQTKKTSAIKKLEGKGGDAEFRIVMFNADATSAGYVPQSRQGMYHVAVDIESGEISVKPPAP